MASPAARRPLVDRNLALDVCRVHASVAGERAAPSRPFPELLSRRAYGLAGFILSFVCGHSPSQLAELDGDHFYWVESHDLWLLPSPRRGSSTQLFLPRMVDGPFASVLTLLIDSFRARAGESWYRDLSFFPPSCSYTHSRRIRDLLRSHGVSVSLVAHPSLVVVPGPWGPVVQTCQALEFLDVALPADPDLFPLLPPTSRFFLLSPAGAESGGGLEPDPESDLQAIAGLSPSTFDALPLRRDIDESPVRLIDPSDVLGSHITRQDRFSQHSVATDCLAEAPVVLPGSSAQSAASLPWWPARYGSCLAADYSVALAAFLALAALPDLIPLPVAVGLSLFVFVLLAGLDSADRFNCRRMSLWCVVADFWRRVR